MILTAELAKRPFLSSSVRQAHLLKKLVRPLIISRTYAKNQLIHCCQKRIFWKCYSYLICTSSIRHWLQTGCHKMAWNVGHGFLQSLLIRSGQPPLQFGSLLIQMTSITPRNAAWKLQSFWWVDERPKRACGFCQFKGCQISKPFNYDHKATQLFGNPFHYVGCQAEMRSAAAISSLGEVEEPCLLKKVPRSKNNYRTSFSASLQLQKKTCSSWLLTCASASKLKRRRFFVTSCNQILPLEVVFVSLQNLKLWSQFHFRKSLQSGFVLDRKWSSW